MELCSSFPVGKEGAYYVLLAQVGQLLSCWSTPLRPMQCLPFTPLLLPHVRCGPLPPPAPTRVRSSQFALRTLLYTFLSLLHCVRSEVGSLILDAFPLLSQPWLSLSSTFLSFFQPLIQGPST